MRLRTLVGLAALTSSLFGQAPDWTQQIPPFRIADKLYYVGSKGLASYLVVSSAGLILINSNLDSSPPQIKENVEKLGYKFADVKILLISHAHWDHCAGSSKIKQMTGAKYMVMDADVPEIEAGGKGNFQYGESKESLYPPTKVDRVLHDQDEVKLGDITLVAHLTPGHTKGCTTFTMKATDSGKSYNVVIVGSPNVNPGYKLVRNARYPNIASDYERSFQVLKALPCDIFLGAHGAYFDMDAKIARMKQGGPNVFVDPEGYKSYLVDREQAFRNELKKQQTDKSGAR